ncbi:MAG TPA: hypothetical protein VKU41_06785, partial [Polyangiaceae bacterium]|nr:hypothetical protein [Polyangiaceae bacterium]
MTGAGESIVVRTLDRSESPDDRHPIEQRALTMVHRVRVGAAAALHRRLNALGDDVAKQTAIPFAKLDRVHFLRWVVLDGEGDGPALLAFESNHDGDTGCFLSGLVDAARAALDTIYGACEGYPGPAATRGMVLAYLEGGAVPTAAFYIAFPGKTVDAIARESRVRDALESFLDADRGVQPATAIAIRERAKTYLAARGLDPPPPVQPPPRWPDWVGLAAKNPGWLVAAGAVVAVPLFPITLGALAGWAYLRHLESTDPVDAIDRDPTGVTR